MPAALWGDENLGNRVMKERDWWCLTRGTYPSSLLFQPCLEVAWLSVLPSPTTRHFFPLACRYPCLLPKQTATKQLGREPIAPNQLNAGKLRTLNTDGITPPTCRMLLQLSPRHFFLILLGWTKYPLKHKATEWHTDFLTEVEETRD